ncbi:MAG: class I tRNA ligase family protein, partial [bacterium]|nr:class I tRNA ligase family protein [bacterium]
NWAGSSWYFLRYIDPKNKRAFADPKKLKYWMGSVRRDAPQGDASGVDWYNGGMEHVTLHLLYSRFWNRFLYDLGLVPVAEPYKKRTAHGIILAEGGVKMSKSKGNVVNPDPLVKEFGADALRLYEMFMGPFNQAIAWDKRGILGTSRFLERVWKLYGVSSIKYQVSSKNEEKNKNELQKLLHKTIKKVSEDIEAMHFNTAISAMMIFINEVEKQTSVFTPKDQVLFLKILAPFAPHIAEELWDKLTTNDRRLTTKNNKSIHIEDWPKYDPKLLEDETFILVVQINGRVRDSFEVSKNITQAEAEKLTFARKSVEKHFSNSKPKRVIYVPGRLINIVI